MSICMEKCLLILLFGLCALQQAYCDDKPTLPSINSPGSTDIGLTQSLNVTSRLTTEPSTEEDENPVIDAPDSNQKPDTKNDKPGQGRTRTTKDPRHQTAGDDTLFIYFLAPGLVILFIAGCAMRFKYRKSKPWDHAHRLRRQAAYLKQGMPLPQPPPSTRKTIIYTTTYLNDHPDKAESIKEQQISFTDLHVIKGPV